MNKCIWQLCACVVGYFNTALREWGKPGSCGAVRCGAGGGASSVRGSAVRCGERSPAGPGGSFGATVNRINLAKKREGERERGTL